MSACAVLHHAQIGTIDNRHGKRRKPIDIKVSETGINLREAQQIAGIFASKRDNENMATVVSIIELFQMGPKTGNGVYNDKYAENLAQVLHSQCPTGKITGLVAIRESASYPVVSGEIVRISGYCVY